jgi:ribosomal protein S18 acetylase RimI-like enzyme
LAGVLFAAGLALWFPPLPRVVRILDGLVIGLGGVWLAASLRHRRDTGQLVEHQISIRIAVAGDQTILAALGAHVQELHARERPEVEQIGVDPAYTRQGIARALFRHITEAAIADGVSEIELNTWTFNRTAQLAFERLGFVAKNLRFVRHISTGEGERRHGSRSKGSA